MKALRWFGIILVGLIAIGMVMRSLGIEQKTPVVNVPVVRTCTEARENQARIPNPNGNWMFLWAFETGRHYEVPLWWSERSKVIYQSIDQTQVNTGTPCRDVMYRVK